MQATDTQQARTVRIEARGERAQAGDTIVLENLENGLKVSLLVRADINPGPAVKLALEHETGDEFDIPLKDGPVSHRFEAIERPLPSGK